MNYVTFWYKGWPWRLWLLKYYLTNHISQASQSFMLRLWRREPWTARQYGKWRFCFLKWLFWKLYWELQPQSPLCPYKLSHDSKHGLRLAVTHIAPRDRFGINTDTLRRRQPPPPFCFLEKHRKQISASGMRGFCLFPWPHHPEWSSLSGRDTQALGWRAAFIIFIVFFLTDRHTQVPRCSVSLYHPSSPYFRAAFCLTHTCFCREASKHFISLILHQTLFEDLSFFIK